MPKEVGALNVTIRELVNKFILVIINVEDQGGVVILFEGEEYIEPTKVYVVTVNV